MRFRLVDDTPEIAAFVGVWLRGQGHDVEVTTSEFASLLGPEPWQGIDAAIVDLHLPDVDGLDVLRYLQAEFPHVKRVAFSAISDPVEDVYLVADLVLAKPIGAHEFLVAMESLR